MPEICLAAEQHPSDMQLWVAIDQLHTRAKEFNWRDVTSGCSFAVT